MNILGVLCFTACILCISACDFRECCACKGIYIKNVKTGLALSVTSDPAVLVVMDTPRGYCEQVWEYKDGMLYNKKSGLVLTVGPLDGHVAILKMEIPSGKPEQKWTFLGNGAIVGNKGLTLDVFVGRTHPGAEVIGYFQTQLSDNQKFHVVSV